MKKKMVSWFPQGFDESPNPDQLKKIIRRLREQLEVSKQALGEPQKNHFFRFLLYPNN